MRRLPGVLMAAVVGPLAIVGGSQAGQPGLVQGGGENSDGWKLSFTGYDSKDTGQVQVTTPIGTQRHGVVDCVVIGSGNRAVLTGTMSNGDFFRLRAQDNGEGANAAADRAQFQQTEDPFTCTVDTPIPTMVNGDVQVK